MDGTGLANTVEPANALLHELGVFGKVPKDEMVGKLEVATFASDLGTEEHTGTFGIGKVSGLTVALDEIQTFMKLAEVEINLFLNRLVNFLNEGTSLADEQDFFIAVFTQPFNQPCNLLLEGGVIIGGGLERVKHRLALWKSFEFFAGIAKHDPPGPETVDDVFNQLSSVGFR